MNVNHSVEFTPACMFQCSLSASVPPSLPGYAPPVPKSNSGKRFSRLSSIRIVDNASVCGGTEPDSTISSLNFLVRIAGRLPNDVNEINHKNNPALVRRRGEQEKGHVCDRLMVVGKGVPFDLLPSRSPLSFFALSRILLPCKHVLSLHLMALGGSK